MMAKLATKGGGVVCVFGVSVWLMAWVLLASAEAPVARAPQEKVQALKSPTGANLFGPYKVLAGDFTGHKNGILDLAVAYLDGVITVMQGDGKGNFSRVGITGIPYDNRPFIEEIFNIAQGDADGDGLPDLAVGVGGTSESPPGRVVILKNMGAGRFERMAEFPVESMAKGVALADLSNSGRLDLLYTARGSGNKNDLATGRLIIRQGLGNWKFGPPIEFEAGESAYYVETADLNHDGFLDVLVPDEHKPTVQIYMNPGKDCFKDAKLWKHTVLTASPIPGRRHHCINDVRAADFHGNGKLDLVTANLGTNTISIFPGNGDGTYQRDTLYDAGGYGAFFAVGDLRMNGHLDFVVTHWAEDSVAVFLNRGDGAFFPGTNYKTGLGCYGVTLCDVNGDGKLDIVTANYRDRSLSILKGNGDGTFQPAVTTRQGILLKDDRWVPE